MREIIILSGLPASGKSTWAKHMVKENPGVYKRINKDDLRKMLDCSKWSKKNEQFILKTRDFLIKAALEDGWKVLVDDTNFSKKHFRRIEQLAKSIDRNIPVTVKTFDCLPTESIKRDANREASVGESVIKRMHQQFVVPSIQKLEQDETLDKAIISDIDGTLAIVTDRSPYDTALCGQDKLNVDVATILTIYKAAGYKILLVTGREDRYRPQTEEWLEKHNIEYGNLWMRKTRDRRKDYDVKKEIYYSHINGRYYVQFILDDRDQVVDFWRATGLSCFQVNYGYF